MAQPEDEPAAAMPPYTAEQNAALDRLARILADVLKRRVDETPAPSDGNRRRPLKSA